MDLGVAGTGILTGVGTGVEEVWTRLASPADDGAEPRHRVSAELAVPRRIAKKTDRFAHLAFASVREAMGVAGRLGAEAADAGVWWGTSGGGTATLARAFESSTAAGPEAMSPWVATAWFPASAQGWLSIEHQLLGASRTFAAGRVSGAIACHMGALAVRAERNDWALVGGADAAPPAAHPNPFRPFDIERAGHQVGEGAAALVLERPGGRALGYLLSSAVVAGPPADPQPVERAIRTALRSADLVPDDIAFVVAEGAGTRAGDRAEAVGIARVLGRETPVTSTKAAYGHLYGASFPAEVVLAVESMRRGFLPPLQGVRRPDRDGCPVNVTVAGFDADLPYAVVLSTGDNGTAVAAVLARDPR
ncbi:beta-ketoacyl synthase N-terminal-like domain-containing protein [Nocardia iowensis]|uniref:Ketosynthase family 3 (KS3) domain-containing protein n=1 Tax=Nocardia iowensis TaxID=204891 RepID=A0ABX8RFJ1_NOCIO|nr:beta-ketoacyl synthase N-terminal-like domain-containing protein [Nocardia iowensis]QXN88372.1 hypothetical protein KV110_22495 [Nocardia iowensis]